MDWNAEIEKNREALKRILAMLVAMAGLAGGDSRFPSPMWGFEADLPIEPVARSSAEKAGEIAEQSGSPAKREASGGGILPRHLHRAVLRLLRPAESAVRRLVIVAARGLVVAPPSPSRRRKANPAPTILRDGIGTGILMPLGVPGPPPLTPPHKGEGGVDVSESPSPLWGGVRGGGRSASARPLALPLFDRLPRWESRPRRPAATSVPRISVPGFTTPFPIVPRRLPSPNDPVDATRLGRRLATLAAALDDLPRQAKRFARWRARRDAITAQNRDTAAAPTGEPRRRSKPRRIWPLRRGRPPGSCRRPTHEVHEVLNVTHGLAFWALERRDSS